MTSINRYEISWENLNGSQGKTSVLIRKHGKAAAQKLSIKKREEKNNQRLLSS